MLLSTESSGETPPTPDPSARRAMVVDAFCLDTERGRADFAHVEAALLARDWPAYYRLMADPWVECFDWRVTSPRTEQSADVFWAGEERVFNTDRTRCYIIYRLRDRYGRRAFSWALCTDQAT